MIWTTPSYFVEDGVSTSPSVSWDLWRFFWPSCFILPAFLRLLVFEVELESSTSKRLVPNPYRLFEYQSSITSAAAISRCWVYPQLWQTWVLSAKLFFSWFPHFGQVWDCPQNSFTCSKKHFKNVSFLTCLHPHNISTLRVGNYAKLLKVLYPTENCSRLS